MAQHRPRLVTAILVLLLATMSSAPAQARRIGLLSGTFDPLHGGHIELAEKAVQLLDLDLLYFLPNIVSNEKPFATRFEHRYNLVRLAVLRNPRFRLPPLTLLEHLYKTVPLDWKTAWIQAVIDLEGPNDEIIQICGADSFLKMAERGHLPRPTERRVVAVMARKGYELEVPATARSLVQAGRIRFFDPDIPELSSTRLRSMLQDGELPSTRELPSYLRRYIQRNLLYGAFRPAVQPPARSRIVRGRFLVPMNAGFSPRPFADFYPPSILEDPLSLDFDRYLDERLPPEIQDLILTRGLRVIVVGGLLDDALGFLQQEGYDPGTVFIPADPRRIDLCYILTSRKRVPALVVTNVFGEDRLAHLVLQFGQLLARNLLPADKLEIFSVNDYEQLDDRLCAKALRSLQGDERTLVSFGYRGALNYVVSDLLAFLQAKGFPAYGGVTQEELDEFRRPLGDRHLLEVPAAGSPEFPYWIYWIPDARGQLFRVIAFRNLYGDQAATAIRELTRLGFRQFALFGNAGGLGNTRIGQVYAPVQVTQAGRNWTLRNAAIRDYPPGIGVSVRSVLEESVSWLESHRTANLVDVENAQAAQALKPTTGLSLYSAVLVSDLPGRMDITRRDEDSPEFLGPKREFFFRLLQRIITGEFRDFPRFRSPGTSRGSFP